MPRPPDWYAETDPKALEVFINLQRRMTPAEKTAGVFQMNEMLWRTTEAHERQTHPQANEREIFLRVAAHHLDRDTMFRVYGWCPPDDSNLPRSAKIVTEKRFLVHYTSGETEIVHALQAIEDDEPEGYLAFVDAEGIMKGLFYKPIVDRWEESAEI